MRDRELLCTLAAICTGSGSHSAKSAVDRAMEILREVDTRLMPPTKPDYAMVGDQGQSTTPILDARSK